MSKPGIKYFAEGGVAAAKRSLTDQKKAMWQGLAALCVVDSDSRKEAEQKRLLVHLAVATCAAQLISLVLWSSSIACLAFALAILIAHGGAFGWLVANKDLSALRWSHIASGLFYFVIYFVSERCQPFSSTGGKVLNMVVPTVLFHIPSGGHMFAYCFVLCVYAAIYIVVSLIEATLAGPCFSATQQHATGDYLVGVLVMEVFPWLICAVATATIFRSREKEMSDRADEQTFGSSILAHLDAGDIASAVKQSEAFIMDAEFVPTPIDLALCHALSQAQSYKNAAATAAAAAAAAQVQPLTPEYLSVPAQGFTSEPLQTQSSFGKISKDPPTQSPVVRSTPTAPGKRPSFVAFAEEQQSMPGVVESRRGSNKTADSETSVLEVIPMRAAISPPGVADEGDGELARPGSLRRRGSLRRGSLRAMPMTKQRRFIALISLPQLADYLSHNRSEPEMAKLLLSEHCDNVRRAIGAFSGRVLGTCFADTFVAFESCGTAVAACVYLQALIDASSGVHKDAVVAACRPFDSLCAIVSSDVVVADIDSVPMGWSDAESLLQVVRTFYKQLVSPPAVLIAESLASLVEKDFVLAPKAELGFQLVTKAAAKDISGLPVTLHSEEAEAMHLTDDFDFAMPNQSALVLKVARLIDSSFSGSYGDGYGNAQSVEFNEDGDAFGSPDGGDGSGSISEKHGSRKGMTRDGKRRRLNPEVLAIWKRYDVDNSGSLDADEIREVLDSLGIMMTETEMQEFYSEVDRDGNGVISQEEFTKACFQPNLGGAAQISAVRKAAAAMKASTGVDNLPVVIATWKKYDADGSGALDADELAKVLTDLGIATTLEEVEWMVKKLDTNNNGTVDFEEFASLFSEDVADIKLNIVKQRIQTVARVMENKRSQQVFTTADQSHRESLVQFAQLVDIYLSPILLVYISYNFGQQLYRVSLQGDQDSTVTEVIIEMCIDLIYIFWVVLKMAVLPRDVSGHVLFSREDVLWDYVTSIDFWIDVAVILPLDFAYIGMGLNAAVSGTYGFYRLNKVLAVYHFDERFSQSLQRKMHPGTYRVTNAMAWYLLASHVFACGLIITARQIGEALMFDMTGTSVLISGETTRYLFALLWATQTLAGNVRGGCLQDTDEQQVLLTCIVLSSLVIFPTLLAIVGDTVTAVTAESSFLERVDSLRSYFSYARRRMNEKEAAELEIECIRYYRHLFETTGSMDITNNPLLDIPAELLIQVTVETGTEMLKKVPIFKEACENIEFVHELTVKLVPRVVEPGTYVMRKGERGTNMYFITYGDFHIVVEGVGIVFTLRKGNFFGEIALLHNVKRTATIMCDKIRYANVLTLDKRDFDEVMQTFPQCLSAISKAAEDRLNQILAAEAEEQRKLKEQRLAEAQAKVALAPAKPESTSNPATPSRGSHGNRTPITQPVSPMPPALALPPQSGDQKTDDSK